MAAAVAAVEAAARRRRLPLTPAPPKARRFPAPVKPRPSQGPPPSPPPPRPPSLAQLLLLLLRLPLLPLHRGRLPPGKSGACLRESLAGERRLETRAGVGVGKKNAVKIVQAVPFLPAGPSRVAQRPGTVFPTPFGSGAL